MRTENPARSPDAPATVLFLQPAFVAKSLNWRMALTAGRRWSIVHASWGVWSCRHNASVRMSFFSNSTTRPQTIFLLVAAAGLTPIALLYGFAPAESMAWIFGIDATGLNARHIFRAFMGLYLALVGFWIAGAFTPHLRTSALLSLFIFMVGLAFGRLVSLVVDGWPHPLLIFYLMLEITFAIIGWRMLKTAGLAGR
jgi:Domain of unknown function (DUF4345)